MASPLAAFQGEAIYLDTNVLVGLVDADSSCHPACSGADRKFKRYFCPGVYGSAPPERPPPGLSIDSLYRCLRPQVGSLALSGSKSHGGGGVYHFACLFAFLIRIRAEVCS